MLIYRFVKKLENSFTDRKSSRRNAEESTGRGNVCACVCAGYTFCTYYALLRTGFDMAAIFFLTSLCPPYTKQPSSGSVDLHGAHFRGGNKYAGTYTAKMSTVVLIFAGWCTNRCFSILLSGCETGQRFRCYVVATNSAARSTSIVLYANPTMTM